MVVFDCVWPRVCAGSSRDETVGVGTRSERGILLFLKGCEKVSSAMEGERRGVDDLCARRGRGRGGWCACGRVSGASPTMEPPGL